MSDAPSVQQFGPDRAAGYDDRIRRLCPGYDVLQDTVASVLAARLPERAHLLVAGAGTGAEIVRMGQAHSGWRFTAVDPSPAMLDRCRSNVSDAGLENRVEYLDAAVEEMPGARSFDAATSLLVTHFIDGRAATQRYVRGLAERLPPGAPLVWADLHRPASNEAFRTLWAAWRTQMRARLDADTVEDAFEEIEEGISFVRPAALTHIVTDAGFTPPTPIYRQLLWGGWIASRRAD
ncbi:class I SAM-dependent methyltransferase [Salinibacter sp.]|uniref:class I SAM-dependent methyltransferase n=1 Tax=Salinibacter sp. TaxID=2065818 RepID=UPI0021E7ED43|nr:class I SAM-dependent methyltransferase [Salinibacter sp.]